MTANRKPTVRVEGRCLCGQARYQVDGRLQGLMLHCHCQRCRKHYGSTFASFVGFEDAQFHWLAGQERIQTFTSEELIHARAFCGSCGSTMPGPDTSGPVHGCSAGNILDMPKPATVYHFYLKGKAPWFTAPSDAPHLYQLVHPDYRDPGLQNLNRPCTAGKVCGSCLCGTVSFEAEKAVAMRNCHCSRCRLSRSSAFATNLFVAGDDFHWRSGADSVVNYRLPDAQRFGSAFCRHCGSLVPRLVRADQGRINIPAGCLDCDPGIVPGEHIFVGSAAPWFEIQDSLPQWQARPS